MLMRPLKGQRWVWVGLLTSLLLAACGGGNGSSPPEAAQAPKTLSIRLQGPSQVRAGESLQLIGSVDAGSALPTAMAWQLLERPAGSQASIGQSQGSSELLRTDLPGRYTVGWTVVGPDGQQSQRQMAVEAVAGPMIETSSASDQLRLGQSTLLQASLPATDASGATIYRWTLLQGPNGSRAQLSGSFGSEVSLTADVAGDYQVAVEARQGDVVTRTVRTLSAVAKPSVGAVPVNSCGPFFVCAKQAVGVPIALRAYLLGSVGSAKVNYQWLLRRAPSGSKLGQDIGTGESTSFTPDLVGDYLVELVPSSPDLNMWGGSVMYRVVEKPVGTIAAPGEVIVGQVATLDASANLTAAGVALTGWQINWALASAPKGSNATVVPNSGTAATAKLRPDVPGDYVISLSTSDVPDYARVTLRAKSVDAMTVYPPKLQVPQGPFIPAEEVKFKAESGSELDHAIVHEWKFGDGSSATGDSVSHRYAYPGIYQVQVVARDTITQRFARQTMVVTVVANRLDNIPPVPCKEETCPAAAADRYAGTGIGRWQLVNDQPHSQAVNIDIAGLSTGQQVLLSLTNASGDNAGLAELGKSEGMGNRQIASLMTQAASPTSTPQPLASFLQRQDEAHAERQDRDRAVQLAFPGTDGRSQARSGRRFVQSASAREPLPVPAIDSSKDWFDSGNGMTYKSRLVDSCSLPSGRKVLFWVDSQATANDLLSPTQVADDFKPMVCGEQGGFQRLQTLLGAEVFGLHDRNDIISDAALQPIQILLADPGPGWGWGAFVFSGDLVLKKSLSVSNEAVLMVVNARYIKTDLNFIKSSLIHEFMHQVNNYQRWILNKWARHESWLEETTAMMAEDLLSSSLIAKADGSPYAAMAARIANYQSFPFTSQYLGGDFANYSIGGSLAAYLDRRLGAGLLRGLTFNCPNEGLHQGSLRCLDDQVFGLSGAGLPEHYAAMNLSVIAPFNATDGAGLGMPAYVGDTVDLPVIDLATLGKGILREQVYSPWTLYPGSHVYLWESATSAANGHYRRKGIMVPPGHVLQIMIR